MEGFLQKYGVDGIDLVYAHNDDMALGAIEAIEAAGGTPGEDIKIVSIDAVKDGMQALVDGKINFIVECNPLLGEQAADLVKKVVDGERRRQGVLRGGPELHRRSRRPRSSTRVRTDPAAPVTVNECCSAGCRHARRSSALSAKGE